MNMTVNSAIKAARKVLMEYWPLHSFIASNPLWRLTDQPFFNVISQPWFNGLMDIHYYAQQYQAQNINQQDLIEAIELIENHQPDATQLESWISESLAQAYDPQSHLLIAEQIEEYQFQKPTVWIKENVFSLLRDYFGLAHYKNIRLIDFWQKQDDIKHINPSELTADKIEHTIEQLIQQLGIPTERIAAYLQTIYLQVYGWGSLMNWRNLQPDNPWLPGQDPCELILLIWLYYEHEIAVAKGYKYQETDEELSTKHQLQSMRARYVWQTAFELHYFHTLESNLNTNPVKSNESYDAQFIFCIDTRSEGLRRHLESQGNYQTFGYAGFFGAIFKLNDHGNITYQAPALVKPTHTVNLQKKPNKLQLLVSQFKQMMNASKKQLASPFALFEIMGFWFALYMLVKNMQSALAIKTKKQQCNITHNLPTEETFQAAYNLLNTIGLVDNFSPWVFICAHQSDNMNNPFKSSLNCGACGGNSGIPNAIVMCQILNDETIRLKLQHANIHIPDHTRFIPACHHTCYDRLVPLEFADNLPEPLKQAIERATQQLRDEKTNDLPGNNRLSARENNWSELIPELGLINNTAMIIGPRELTANQNLNRKTFLHSYDPTLDSNGDILTTILAAPAIVAHWISSQYYFSTVNPTLFGAGNKALHNVLPGIGVLEGNLSDLKVGLPLQSTHFQSIPMHEPRRIIVVIYAHKKIFDQAMKNAPAFKALADNQWIYVKHIEAE